MEKYRAIPQGYMTAGAVAKKMGVTVRTLQHYDKEGLLSPSAMSEGGRRLYTDKDIIKLHQILSLKHLGFSLDDIRDRLIPLDNPTDEDRRRSEQDKQVIQELVSDISHQVKTPVSNLKMVTDTLLTYPVSDAERTDFVRQINLQAFRLRLQIVRRNLKPAVRRHRRPLSFCGAQAWITWYPDQTEIRSCPVGH